MCRLHIACMHQIFTKLHSCVAAIDAGLKSLHCHKFKKFMEFYDKTLGDRVTRLSDIQNFSREL